MSSGSIKLPPGLPFDISKASAFFEILFKNYGEYSYAIEIRNKSWLTMDAFSLLEKYGISFTMADSGGRYPYFEKITSDFIYLRFHGNGQIYASDYSDNELQEYAKKNYKLEQPSKEHLDFF